MSIYNLLHGVNANAANIFTALGLDPAKISRLRDTFIVKTADAYVICVYTRTGGGNRADYPNTVLTSHPLYLRDHDDESDNTYAHYLFRIPQTVLDDLAAQGLTLADVADDMTPTDKTAAVLEALEAESREKENL